MTPGGADETTRSAPGGPAHPGGSRLSSTALFGDAREIVILHRGQEYRLRITKTDKLILTK